MAAITARNLGNTITVDGQASATVKSGTRQVELAGVSLTTSQIHLVYA